MYLSRNQWGIIMILVTSYWGLNIQVNWLRGSLMGLFQSVRYIMRYENSRRKKNQRFKPKLSLINYSGGISTATGVCTMAMLCSVNMGFINAHITLGSKIKKSIIDGRKGELECH